MKKNFSKALAGTLTVAMVLGMAAPAAATTAQAAKKNGIKTKYSAIYAGKSKTYTLKTAKKTTKWSVTGEGKQYVTLSAKKGKKVTVKIAKDAPAGVKATVVAKLANKKGKYKKVDADKFTIKVDATAVAVEGNGDVKTGSTATYTAKTTPAKTTNHVYFSVTDKDGKATTGATMNATSGVLTANAAGEYKVNVATARGDKKAAAGTFTATASMDVKVTDPVAPEAKLTSAKQTEAKKFALTFDSELKDIKPEDFTFVNDSDKTSKVIKSVSIGTDKKTATLETLIDVMDGKSYTVTYKGSTAQFTATDGTVADFALNNDKFQIKKKQELKVKVLDKNQVVIKTIDVKSNSVTEDNGKYTINTTSNDSTFTDDKLVMQNVGKTEEVTVTYHSQKYNSTSGAEEGNVEKKFTITAIAQADLKGSYEKATISDAKPADWDKATCTLQLPVGDTKYNKLFVKLLDVEGVETINGIAYDEDLKITCTSSDDTILLVDASEDNVVLTGVKAGTAYVQIKQNGVTKLTIPVTVVAKRTLKNVVLNATSTTLSNSKLAKETKEIEASTAKDQYSKDIKGYKIDEIKVTGKPSIVKSDDVALSLFGINADDDKKATFEASGATAGTYKYEITYKDLDTDDTVKRTTSFTVKHCEFAKAISFKLTGDDSKDVALKHAASGENKNDYEELSVGVYFDGVLGAKLNAASCVNSDFQFLKSGSKVTDKNQLGAAAKTVTNAAVDAKTNADNVTKGAIAEAGKYVITDKIYFGARVSKSDNKVITYYDKAGVANYEFKFTATAGALRAQVTKAVVEKASDAGINADVKATLIANIGNFNKDVKLNKSFSIKDTQPTLTVVQTKNNVDATSAEDAIKKTCEFTYDGTTYLKADDDDSNKGIQIYCDNKDGDSTKSADRMYYKNGKVYNIVKMNVYVDVHDDDDNQSAQKVKFEKKPGFSITVND